MTPYWTPYTGPLPTMGSTVYLATSTGRRKAKVVGSKPGHILISTR